MHTIKPIDRDIIKKYCEKSELIISVEEHNIVGGLGSAIAEAKSGIKFSPRHILMGVNDNYSSSGSYENLLYKNKLLGHQIAETIELNI